MACIMIDEHNYFMVFHYLNFYEVPSKSSVSFPIKGKKSCLHSRLSSDEIYISYLSYTIFDDQHKLGVCHLLS